MSATNGRTQAAPATTAMYDNENVMEYSCSIPSSYPPAKSSRHNHPRWATLAGLFAALAGRMGRMLVAFVLCIALLIFLLLRYFGGDITIR